MYIPNYTGGRRPEVSSMVCGVGSLGEREMGEGRYLENLEVSALEFAKDGGHLGACVEYVWFEVRARCSMFLI